MVLEIAISQVLHIKQDLLILALLILLQPHSILSKLRLQLLLSLLILSRLLTLAFLLFLLVLLLVLLVLLGVLDLLFDCLADLRQQVIGLFGLEEKHVWDVVRQPQQFGQDC